MQTWLLSLIELLLLLLLLLRPDAPNSSILLSLEPVLSLNPIAIVTVELLAIGAYVAVKRGHKYRREKFASCINCIIVLSVRIYMNNRMKDRTLVNKLLYSFTKYNNKQQRKQMSDYICCPPPCGMARARARAHTYGLA